MFVIFTKLYDCLNFMKLGGTVVVEVVLKLKNICVLVDNNWEKSSRGICFLVNICIFWIYYLLFDIWIFRVIDVNKIKDCTWWDCCQLYFQLFTIKTVNGKNFWHHFNIQSSKISKMYSMWKMIELSFFKINTEHMYEFI